MPAHAWLRASSPIPNISRGDIVRYLHADPEKIEVIYPGVDPGFRRVTDPARLDAVRSKYSLDRDFILCVGIYKPRKNHAALLYAFQQVLRSGGKAQLVIAGPMAEGEAMLRRLAIELGIAEHIVLTGFVDEPDLCALYSQAQVCVCPSLYEGFGFTVLEAMACGAPVVCSSATSLPEVAGQAVLYFDPNNSEEIASQLLRVLSDAALRTSLIEQGTAEPAAIQLGRHSQANIGVSTIVPWRYLFPKQLTHDLHQWKSAGQSRL